MKKRCIKNFSFLPSDYDCMSVYLDEMLRNRYRLKWVKAGFAGFEYIDQDEHITYAIEPYANTSLISLRRLSRTWLNFYTGNEWYYIGKSRGNYIYFTRNRHPKPPSSTSNLAVNDSKEKVISTEIKRNAAMLISIAFMLYKLAGSKAFMYAFVLTSLYQYLAVILAVIAASSAASIILYSLETVRMQMRSFVPSSETGLKFGMLYHVRNTLIIVLALIFFIIDNVGHPSVLIYLLLPVIVLTAGGIIIAHMADRNDDSEKIGRKIMPYAYVVGGITLLLLIFSMNRIQSMRSEINAEEYSAGLAAAEGMPHIAYDEFFDYDSIERVKTNISRLGRNYLYEEADVSRENIVFTNLCSMRTSFAADRIYDYLYAQAENDYSGSFEYIDMPAVLTSGSGYGLSICTIPKQNAYLIRSGNSILLTTVSGDNIDHDHLQSLIIDLAGKLK